MASQRSRRAALLAMEDGSVFPGWSFGAEGETFGEAVFNTGMAGYQEVLTDPSYARQIVTMTSPHQGNYGMNELDPESPGVQVAGLAVREVSRIASSWRATGTLADVLRADDVVAIEGIDTRRLTLRLREAGSMRAAISTLDLEPASLVARVCSSPGMEGADLAASVSVTEPYEGRSVAGPASTSRGPVFRVAAIDYGIKRNSLRLLAEHGIDTTVYPATTRGSDIADGGFDGVFLSNGPGDPAATSYGVALARELLGVLPIFGICLGHQLLAQALGGRTYKMKFGHRGVNQPVEDLDTGAVEITSHNHGFAVEPDSWGHREGQVVETAHGRAALTHRSLNDGTLEGLRCLDLAAFSVQYHPEAAPGPHDARHLFDRFRTLLEAS